MITKFNSANQTIANGIAENDGHAIGCKTDVTKRDEVVLLIFLFVIITNLFQIYKIFAYIQLSFWIPYIHNLKQQNIHIEIEWKKKEKA